MNCYDFLPFAISVDFFQWFKPRQLTITELLLFFICQIWHKVKSNGYQVRIKLTNNDLLG